jgi:hypothetical protein
MLRLLFVYSLMIAASVAVQAEPTGPVYPPPGGVTFAGSGDSGTTGGRTNFYSNFDPLQYEELFWTFYSIANPRHSSQGATTGNMAFAGYDSATGISTWSSTANMTWTPIQGTQSIATKFVMQLQPFTGTNGGPLGGGWIPPVTAADAGITSLASNWPLIDVAALSHPTDSFQVWYQYQTASGTPLLTYYNTFNNPNPSSVITSASGGFYYTAVPEPSTGMLLLLTGAGLATRLRQHR